MPNLMKSYLGTHLWGRGTPVIIITGSSTVSGTLYAEYFIFFNGPGTFQDGTIFRYKYSSPAPHRLKRDVRNLMSLALRAARARWELYIEEEYRKTNNFLLLNPIKFESISESGFTTMCSLGFNLKYLNALKKQNQIQSPKLRVFLDKVAALSAFVRQSIP